MRDSAPSENSDLRPAEGVVALGASAGGLEALDRYFSTIASDLSAAFVVIQHLAPTHKTMMDSLLARHTKMPVKVAAEGDCLHAGHVYVIPAGVTMTLLDRKLHLDPRPQAGVTHSINDFFGSLGQAACDRIVAVILSGTGSDGAGALQGVVDAGGWVLVQQPESAAFDGMPLNALATGLAHETGTPEELARFTEGVIRENREPQLVKIDNAAQIPIEDALQHIGEHIEIDLSNYKPHTLVRRLERRMLATGQHDVGAYLRILETNKGEVTKLRRDMMIPVTAFFRDSDAFAVIAQKVIKPDLLSRSQSQDSVYRIWSVGCATGPEAYSIAITALEAMRELGIETELKVFATDIEPSYLAQASAGVYPGRMLLGIPTDVRDRYFNPLDGDTFQVTPRLRRAVNFSRHDVLRDPPFLHLDLILCRNMVIYLRAEPQERALRRMLFGLKGSGAVMMGSSETPGKLAPLLDTVSGRNKIFRLRGELRHLSTEDFLLSSEARRARQNLAPRSETIPQGDVAQALAPAADCLISAFVPPSVVVDANREIRHVFGDVVPFLRFKPGDASLDLIHLLPHRVGAVVSTLIFSALRDRTETKSVFLHPDDDEHGFNVAVNLQVRPINLPGSKGPPSQLAVSFERITGSTAHTEATERQENISALTASRVTELETELGKVRATLKTTIEELGSANEELQASNEELMASNEELQSTIEELQSVNEELHAVNTELQEKIMQLNEAYADLEGLSRAARIPLIFLDGQGRITRFSAQATEVFRLRDHDTGRPLAEITHRLTGFDVEAVITAAMKSQASVRQEIPDRSGRSWLVTVQPFVGRTEREARIVLSFIDISSVQTMRYLQSIVDSVPQNLVVLDADGGIVLVNDAWKRFAMENGGTNTLASGARVNYVEVLRGASAQGDETARQALEGITELMQGKATQFSLIYPCHSATQKRWFLMHASPLRSGGCVVTHLDITNLRIPVHEASPE